MIKGLIFLLLAIFCLPLLAQEPPADVNGEELKQWLKVNFYDGKHTELGYSDARLKMYTDIDNHDGKLICVYSGYQMTYESSMNTNPVPFNCEHTIPQSFFDSAEPMRSDIHHLFPTYGSWNSERSNYPFAEIDDYQTSKWMYLDDSQATIPTSNIDFYSEYYSSRFEPREDHKGNCARAIFYFFTMYPSAISDITRVAEIDVLYQWHLADPVDDAERARNTKVITYQGNSNPYIEYPALVERAWVTANSGPIAPSISLGSTTEDITLTWTDLNDETGYSVFRSNDNISYAEVASLAENSDEYVDEDVQSSTNYYYYLVAFNDDGNSPHSNIVSGTLQTSSNGSSSDLFFSEYIEGSSYNKALELANFTKQAIDLSKYSIKKQTNGAGEWDNEYLLSGNLADGDVFVICNSQANAEINAVSDVSDDLQIVNFNGNDPVGLFKNGTLIDIIGVFNGGAGDFAKDVTLIRNESISKPNNQFDESEWTEKSVNYTENLGSHTLNIPTDVVDLKSGTIELKIYPIPASTFVTLEITNLLQRDKISYELHDVTGKTIYSRQVLVTDKDFKANISLNGLQQGLYLLRVFNSKETICKRIVIK